MRISWAEVSIGFFAITYIAGRAACQGAVIHSVPVVLLSIPVIFYGLIKGLYCGWKWITEEAFNEHNEG